jgi:hypothetical protein
MEYISVCLSNNVSVFTYIRPNMKEKGRQFNRLVFLRHRLFLFLFQASGDLRRLGR